MTNLFKKFKLGNDKEEVATVIENIDIGVRFRGTNLWILIFAIFVASLGLNINSTAVIIGAMLISPLMGPIMGIGLGMGINDVTLLRKSIYNYLIATGVALSTSTLFFLLSPLNEAHSEILARTSPNIYDVLIAFFGGFAGIVATSSRLKGNVIPGVAIATALMPPLCTAGYGLATFQFQFFFGAFYLFIINTVFIAWATFIFVRVQHFPQKRLENGKADKISHRIVWLVVLVTLLPSIYFGYDIVQQDRFTKNANRFINYEAHIPNDYLLNKKIDAKEKKITLVFGGEEITKDKIAELESALTKYNLSDAKLEVNQGFSYLSTNKNDEQPEQVRQLTQALTLQQETQKALQQQVDSMHRQVNSDIQLLNEIKTQYPVVETAIFQPVNVVTDSVAHKSMLVVLSVSKNLNRTEEVKLKNWLKVRLKNSDIRLVLQD